MAERRRVVRRGPVLQAALTLFVLAGSLPAQQTPVPSVPGPAPEVRLETHDGKSHFYIGELVALDLVFRNTTQEPYMLNGTDYGDLADRVEIAPAKGWMQWQTRSGHDYSYEARLGSAEVRVPIVLNEGFIFREPGHYDVRVTTNRLSRGADIGHLANCGPIRTNAVGIDLAPMPAGVEAQQLKSLMSEIASARAKKQCCCDPFQGAVARLAVLQGDDALRAKIRLILAEDRDMRLVMREALITTRNLPLQLSLLESAWRNPAVTPVGDLPEALQETRALLRRQALPGYVMVTPPLDPVQAARAAKAPSAHQADMEELLRSLPLRSGQSRAQAAFYLMDDRSLPPADIAAAKPVALEEFTSMDDLAQHLLIELRWPVIRDPSLAPALRAMLDKSPMDKDAIQRLIELDPQGSSDYVVRAVCDTHWPVPLESVADLPEATLPAVDGCLGNHLRVPPSRPNDPLWLARAELAGRFASAAILPAIRQGWTSPEQDSAVLPLLLRYEPDEAVSVITKASKRDAVGLFYEIDKVFKSRGSSFPAQLTDLLRRQVEDGTDDEAGHAAYQLSQGGTPEDKLLLEQRLAKLRAQWSSRLGDLKSAPPGSPASMAEGLECSLMGNLRGSTVWTLSDAEAAQLALGCLSDECRQYGKPRGDGQNKRTN